MKKKVAGAVHTAADYIGAVTGAEPAKPKKRKATSWPTVAGCCGLTTPWLTPIPFSFC